MRATLTLTLTLTLALSLSSLSGCGDDDATIDAGVDAAPTDAAPPDAPPAACDVAPRTFSAYDLSVMPPLMLTIDATCRAQGAGVNIWVADDIWGTDMTQADADAVVTAFTSATPADGTRGIAALMVDTFGGFSDVDTNGAIEILYFDIPPYGGFQFDGFIRAEDVLGGSYSNDAEVLYLDGERLDPGGEYMLGVAAHELTHLIFLAHDENEASWVQESLAEAAMVRCGYLGDLDAWVASDFASDPSQTLTQNDATFPYGHGFLFGSYLLEQLGAAFLLDLVNQAADGVAGLEATLVADSAGWTTFRPLLADWAMANYLDAPTAGDGRWGYDAFDVPAVTAAALAPTGSGTVQPHSARYFTVNASTATAGSTLSLTVATAAFLSVEIRVAAFPAADRAAATVTSHTLVSASEALSIAGVGGSVNRVAVAVVETGGSAAASVTLTATLP